MSTWTPAYEVWRYCEESAHFIFGDSLSDPVADRILKALRSNSGGLTRTDVSQRFGRNKTKAEIESAINSLKGDQLIREETVETKGRPVPRLFALENPLIRKVLPTFSGVTPLLSIFFVYCVSSIFVA